LTNEDLVFRKSNYERQTQHLDRRAPRTTGNVDPHLAAMEEVDRPSNARGKVEVIAQCLQAESDPT
jgi:hypothetical protein